MKKSLIIMFMILAVASFAAAQINQGAATQDILGAHLNYGRGCAACHAPHSGAWGNGANKSGDTVSGQAILWGQDTGNLYGQTIITAGGRVEVLPTAAEFVADTQPDVNGLLTCLSCHDGNWAEGAMMKDKVYETLPPSYGTYNNIPTLLGNDGDGAGNYIANHPVGLNATVSCGGQWNWDCTETNGVIQMNGPNSAKFVTNYGFFVSLSAYNNTAVVTCTSCHNQHIMNTVNVTAKKSGLPPGYYATMFFINSPYNPASGTAGSNQTAQFCRQCHGGEANESNGQGQLGTIF
jgi:cytochrome c553